MPRRANARNPRASYGGVRVGGATPRFCDQRHLRHGAALDENGVELLEVPENYYDDLEAKLDLPPEQLDALRRNNVLYDRDGEGEYFQVYTRAFEQRFFFEIVERRGYGGYGAVNAPVRLAAQAGSTTGEG